MKKKIYVCPKCGKALNFSDNPEYTFQCLDCDEDFYEFEAIVKEQEKLEGIKDFTSMVDAATRIKEIKDQVAEDHTRYISIKSQDIVGQVCEYIYETLQSILNTSIHKSSKFRDSAAIYTSNLRLIFGIWKDNGKEYYATLYLIGDYSTSYEIARFNQDEYVLCDNIERYLITLVEGWKSLKDSMNRMIPYAIKEYNEYNAKEIAKIQETKDIIDNFRL